VNGASVAIVAARVPEYWLAEAIPVLIIQDRSDVLEVHGPSGMVRAHPSLVT
jgi:hypothetical protein